MAIKRPLCLYGGRIEELRSADTLPIEASGGGGGEEIPSAASMTYDAAGRIQSVAETLSGGTRTTSLQYDAQGRVAVCTIAYAGSTQTISYAYDSTGRMTGYTVA
jgi:YD repeat-containing protein